MTTTNARFNTGVETSSKACDVWCGSLPTWSFLFTPLSIALTGICDQNASILKCTLPTGGGRHTYGQIPDDDDVLTDVKSTLNVGYTLVPLSFISDRTHLTNFAGDKKQWHLYVMIGNLLFKVRQMPATHSVVMVALLPILIKTCNILQKRLDEQRKTNQQVLNEVLWRVLEPLNFTQNPSSKSGYYNVLSADGNFSRCKQVLAAWLADCPEYSDLHHIEWHIWLHCECPKNELGDDSPPDKPRPWRDHNLYRMVSDANTKGADAELWSCHVQRGFNIFRHIPCTMSDLPKPDLLHSMQIGMLGHLQKCIIHIMKTHKRVDKYNALWLSVPAYHNLKQETKWYEDVSQSNGKEMKELSRYLLGVVTKSLRGWSPDQRPIFNHAIEFTQALLEFYMYAHYKSHDDATLSCMENPLRRLHTFKDVSLLRRAGKEAKANANALRTGLMNKRKADKKTNAETWMPSKMWHEMNAWQDYISHQIDVSKKLDADFIFPKIHLTSHWVEQIHRYGALQQYSAKRHEQAHETNLKDCWNTHYWNHKYLPQVIIFQRRILYFEIRELKPHAFAQHRENSAATCKVLPSGADLAATLSSQSYAKSKFMGLPSHCDVKHHDPMVGDLRALLDDTQDAMLCETLYKGTQEFINHKSRNKTYLSDEQLHTMELCIYHGNKVQLEGLEGECISQMCRCTGSQSWHGWDRRNHWVWLKQPTGRCYGALNGHLPSQLQRLLNIQLLNEDAAFIEYWSALVLTTIPEK